MKKVEAMIRHFKLDAVKQALVDKGLTGMTVSEVSGCGRQHGHTATYRGTQYDVDFVPKVLVEMVVTDDQISTVIDAITNAARTGEIGEGRIAISDVIDAVRIRTAERGAAAL